MTTQMAAEAAPAAADTSPSHAAAQPAQAAWHSHSVAGAQATAVCATTASRSTACHAAAPSPCQHPHLPVSGARDHHPLCIAAAKETCGA
jgi:hypothetical protein